MAFYTLHSDPIKVSYKSKLFTQSSIFYLICIIAKLLIPLVIVYRSEGLWRKIEYYREQPDINFKHQLILILYTNEYTPDHTKFWSTFPELNAAYRSDQLRVPYISSNEIDRNSDGKYDELSISFTVPLNQNEHIIGVKLFLLFDYKLYSKVRLQMESLAIIDYHHSKAGDRIDVFGELRTHQKEPLQYRGYDNRFNQSLITYSPQFYIEDMMETYLRRNLTTTLSGDSYYDWKLKKDDNTNAKFSISATIQYPVEVLYYRPGFWFLIKWFWIQYLSVLIILNWIVNRIIIFVFDNQLIDCIVKYDELLVTKR